MRLSKLDLLCYGAFENRSLALRDNARLHVVYGANEAGKSTTLSAVRDLLFGFQPRTDMDFRFKQTDLRIGGELVSAAGARLSFVRRKGNKNTLLDADGKPLADDALAPFLGHMNREVFLSAFGLNADSLRKGAEELLQARGEAGSSLMAAASGLRGLASLRKQLDEEADAVFTPNKSQTRRFYQARDRYENAKKAISESELLARAWKKLNEDIAQSGARLAALKEQLGEVRAQSVRIERLKSLTPLVRRIDAQQELMVGEADLPRTPPGFIAELDAALAAAENAGRAVERENANLTESARALADIAVDAALLERAAEIEALVQRVSQHQKNNVDLPRVSSEHDSAKSELDRHARLLGLADGQAAAAAQPPLTALALLRDLADEGQELAKKKALLKDNLRAEFERLEALDAQRAGLADGVDPAPLQEKLAAFGNLEALVSARDEKAAALRRDEAALQQEAANLVPPVGDLAHLAALPLPAADVIAAFVQRSEDILAAERHAAQRARDAEADVETVRQRLEALVAGGEVPTPERIAAARQARDAEWAHLRAALFNEPGAVAGAALAGAVARFEVAGAQADSWADAAARDAARVADYAAQSTDLERRQQFAASLREECGKVSAQRAALEAEWASLWSGFALAPGAPAQMQNWRGRVSALFERHARLADTRADLAKADSELSSLMAPLAALAAEAGLSAMNLDLARQAARVATRLRELASAWDDAREATRKRADIEFRIGRLTRDLKGLASESEAWEARWREAVPAIGLPSAGVTEAMAAMDAWKLAPQLIQRRDELARRVAGLERDIKAFEDSARNLVGEIAADLLALPATTGVAQLSKRLEAARTSAARREEIAKRKAACEEALRKATRAAEAAREALDRLAALLPEGADLADMLQRLKRRDELSAVLEDLRRQLGEQSGGLAEDAIRAEVAGFDLDRAAADLLALAQDEERLSEESRQAYAELKLAEQKVAGYEGGAGSETAWQQRMNAEAELQEAARQWLVLRLASAMLNEALERHRAERQDPLMLRASEIFAKLTGGGFAGIAQSFDESDAAVLQGRRASGELVGVEGLSEGARDQLYLALRLAYVEDFAGRGEPAPFVADDLFTSFDDARTLNGLRALVETGAHLQCILFTHHRHVVDLARAEIGDDADVLEL